MQNIDMIITIYQFIIYMSKQGNFINSLTILQDKLFFSLTSEERKLPIRHIINLFKGATFIWVIILMNIFNNFSNGMYLYLFLHGTYGWFWILKDFTFPDGRFMQKASIGSCILVFIFLVGYWTISYPLAAGYGISNPSTQRIIFLIILYITGLVLMMGSDYQKTQTLKKKKGLISTGFFKYSRNPNYLGQIFIYSSFVLCSGNIVGFIIFYGIACPVFALNIYLKDKLSYQKKSGWEQYKKQSYILLPKVFSTFALNLVFYSIIIILVVSFLLKEVPQGFNYPFQN